MKKLVALLLLSCMLAVPAFADAWFPLGLTMEDDFASAKVKVKEALASQNVDDSRFSYTLVKTNAYYLYDIPIEQILLNSPSDLDWQLMFSSQDLLALNDNLKNIYVLYNELVKKLGEPKEFSPEIKRTTFDGEIVESIFKDEETFLKEMDNMNEKAEITAKFDNCLFRIVSKSSYYFTVYLYFTK